MNIKPLTLEQLRGMEGQKVLLYRMKSTEPLEPGTVKQNGDVLGDAGMLAYHELYLETWVAFSCLSAHIDRGVFCGSWEGEADGYADGELVYDIWRCSGCGHVEETDDPDWLPDFCPDCGLAMTENARAILEKRLRG